MKPSFFLQIIEILFLLSLVAFKDSEILTFLHVMFHHKVELSPPHFQLTRVNPSNNYSIYGFWFPHHS